MTFRTKLDYSDNRQIKQRERTNTTLSGTTTFGVPFSGLTSGPNITTTAQTSQYFGVISNYSGNNTTTIFNWSIPNVSAIDSSISALTPSNSGISQNISAVFGSNSSTIIDGNLVNLSYSGVGATNLYPITMVELTPGNYSGTVSTDFYIYSAETLDFTGRTIWIDNSEILRTKKLIVNENPQIGYVLTCIDSEGMVAFQAVSGGTSGATYWSASTGTYSVVPKFSNSTISGNRSTLLAGQNITGSTDDTAYTPNLIINSGGTGSLLGINVDNPQYTIDSRNSTSNLFYSSSGGGLVALSGLTDIPRFGAIIPKYLLNPTTSVVFGIRSWDDVIYNNYGDNGDAFIYATTDTNGLNLINAQGAGVGDYIRFYAGSTPATSISNLHITGTGSTKGFIGLNTESPTERLDVNGNARFRSIGASASSGALHYDSNGVLTTNTSDARLKTNIEPILDALNKVKQLSGVTYNWTTELDGNKRIGLIAQEVAKVVPELTFVNKNSPDEYMGVHYDNVVALLIEAIKEISNPENLILQTQTIAAEDNNIELNYNGNHNSSIGGGLTIINGISDEINAEFKLNNEGNWVTNNSLEPTSLIIPEYTPTSSNDFYGKKGDVTRDGNYLYIKDNNGWRRIPLQMF
jgi:hypothetical protein